MERNPDINIHNIEQIYYHAMDDLNQLGNVPLYGGIDASQSWIDSLMRDADIPVGNRWCEELHDAKGDVVLQARDLDLKTIDSNLTIRERLLGRDVVILKEGTEIFIASVLIGGQWYMIGKTFRV